MSDANKYISNIHSKSLINNTDFLNIKRNRNTMDSQINKESNRGKINIYFRKFKNRQ